MNRIQASRNFVMIENQLLSSNMQPKLLNENEWKLLLFFNMVANFNTGSTNSGHKRFKRICPCSPAQYKRMVARLEELKFIQTFRFPEPCKFTRVTVLLAPTIATDGLSVETFSEIPKSGWQINRTKTHFSMIPIDALEIALSSKNLSINAVRLLIKLYRYDLDLFGCIDPNVLRIQGGQLHLSRRILFDLSIDFAEFHLIFRELLDKFLLPHSSLVYEETLDLDKRLRVYSADSGVERDNTYRCLLFKPKYQYIGRGANNEAIVM